MAESRTDRIYSKTDQKLEALVQHSPSPILSKHTIRSGVDVHLDGAQPNLEAAEKRPLDLVRQLCHSLSEAQISYCHWKSNNALDLSANGVNDLDLLVSRSETARFNQIVFNLGFKPGIAPADRDMPGVLDYYGFDRGSGRIIHLHVHFQLMIGHDMTKNYHLPIESQFLESARQETLFSVPSPEFEYVIFIIRMVLKHLTWETILIRHGKLSPAERQELYFLAQRVEQDQIKQILARHLPSISGDLFDECCKALKPNAPLWTRIRAGNKLVKALQAHARRGRFHDVTLKLWRRVVWGVQKRILHRSPKRRLATGGAVIAVVGGDGAGKTTAIDGLYDWLDHELAVTRVHLGKPAWSLTTRFIRAALSIGRLLGFYSFVAEADILYANRPDKRLDFSHYALLIRQLLRSRDRRLTYVQARQQAMNGRLVICDRFPLAQINAMDGPIISELVNSEDINRFVGWMIRTEAKNFKYFVWPELVIILKLNPEIAAERKTDEESDYVRARSQLVWSADWQGTAAQVVDASHDKETVLATLKALVWSAF